MIYGPGNAAGAQARDAKTGALLDKVIRVDTDKGILTRGYTPHRLNAAGDDLETFDEHFEAIHVIQGMGPRPTLFICYGRKG